MRTGQKRGPEDGDRGGSAEEKRRNASGASQCIEIVVERGAHLSSFHSVRGVLQTPPMDVIPSISEVANCRGDRPIESGRKARRG